MSKKTKEELRLLKRYPRAIVQLRDQLNSKRLGLVFGAGLSASFKLPNWDKLVKRIASDPDVKGTRILKSYSTSGLPYQTEMLFQHFRSSQRRSSKTRGTGRQFDYDVHAKWRNILWRHLYQGSTELTKATIEQHPYLSQFLRIVRKLQVTVTYNFDDVLERALHITRPEDEVESSRGYVAVTNGALQLRGRTPVIYHPNGLVPKASLMETPSDRLIFSEHSYADQLVNLLSGDHSRLITYLIDHTCLFVGVSLNDQGVRNLLRQCAKQNPGNYHYMISYVGPGERADLAKREAIAQANFHVYNLITLFLDDAEIAALGKLVTMEDGEFCDFAESNGIRTKYCYYLTGPLGVGKSTAIAALGSLNTFDEWVEPRLQILAKLWTKLTSAERRTADKWIIRQFKLKNDNVRKKKAGIYVLDRGPLDPLAFTPKGSWAKKSTSLLSAICPKTSPWHVEPGCVVLLSGDHKEMALRMRLTSRAQYTEKSLKKMRDFLEDAYGRDNVEHLDTTGLSAAAVVNRIAELIHLGDYKEMQLHKRLAYIERTGAP